MKHIHKLLLSFTYALTGILHCLEHERNFRVHVYAAITVYLLTPFYSFTASEMVKLTIVIFIVLITEMFNTSIEEFVDMVSPEYSNKAKIVKDLAAGSVALSALCAVITAGFMLFKIEILINIWNFIISSPIWVLAAVIYIILGFVFVFIPKKSEEY